MEEVQPQPVYRLVQGLQVLNKGGNVNLDAIFQSLVAADKEAEQNSPFRGFEDLSNNIGTMILKGAPDYNMGELLAGGLITGLVGGAAQNMTEGYRDKQNSLAQAVLQGSLTGNSIERPSGMSPSIYSGLNNAGSIFALENRLANAAEDRKAQYQLELERLKENRQAKNDAALAILKAKAEHPYQAGKIDQVFGLSDQAAAPSGVATMGTQSGAVATPGLQAGSLTTGNDAASIYQKNLEALQGNESLAAQLTQRQLNAPDRQMDLRKEFSGKLEIQDFVASDIGFRSLKKAFLDNSGASDQELVRGGIQAIEPGMAVREGEQAALASSASIPEAWKAELTGALTGQSKLSDTTRQGIMRIAQRRYNAHAENFNIAREFYRKEAQNQQLNPDSITYLPSAVLDTEDYGLSSQIRSTPDGKNWRLEGDHWIEVK